MSSFPASASFWKGFRGSLPFLLVLLPFGMLFGVVGTEAGLGIAEVMGFSVVVIAGAAQFTALSLMQDHAPTLVVILTALAVNLRMAMYSAALVPHLGAAPIWKRALVAYATFDQTYAASVAEYERTPSMGLSSKLAYFAGSSSVVIPSWVGATLVGTVAGSTIPDWLALDFAVPITFLAILAPMFRTLAHVAAAAVSVAAALALAWLPSGVGLLIAALLAMVTGAAVETATERGRRT